MFSCQSKVMWGLCASSAAISLVRARASGGAFASRSGVCRPLSLEISDCLGAGAPHGERTHTAQAISPARKVGVLECLFPSLSLSSLSLSLCFLL
mmetsp:Transcript_5314/g.12713  ORF Transcript_5314/g.12713 Transcript_5314/m.12713 type:complete len:95 (+) Transcript_5314:212-496(+)